MTSLRLRYLLTLACGSLLAGCASSGGDTAALKVAPTAGGDIAAAKTEIAAEVEAVFEASAARVESTIDAKMGDLVTQVGEIKTTVGNVDAKIGNIGGGGDSITAWMYAAIAGAAVLYLIRRGHDRAMLVQDLNTALLAGRVRIGGVQWFLSLFPSVARSESHTSRAPSPPSGRATTSTRSVKRRKSGQRPSSSTY